MVVRRTWMMASPDPAVGMGFSSSPKLPGPRKIFAFIMPRGSCFARGGIISSSSSLIDIANSFDSGECNPGADVNLTQGRGLLSAQFFIYLTRGAVYV